LAFLAGLVSIPRELYESAETDGASPLRAFWHITLPLLRPILAIVMLYSTVMTIADFEIIFILTRGGPLSSTHLFSTYAYQVGLVGARISEGAAISLFIFPFLAIAAYLIFRIVRRGEEYA
jgi:multiple sugar transport system permease protein